MAQQTERWVIIGGGILGMTLAYRLAQHGKHVTLFEGAPHLGGLASAWTLGEVVWDRHYHVTLLSDTSLRALLAELGLEQDIQWVETRTGFYTDGRLYSMSNTSSFCAFRRSAGSINCAWGRRFSTPHACATGRSWKPLPSRTGSSAGPADIPARKSGCRSYGRNWASTTRTLQPPSSGPSLRG